MTLSFPTADKDRPPRLATWRAPLLFVAVTLVPLVVWANGLDFNPQRVPQWLLVIALWVWLGAWRKLNTTVEANLDTKLVARALLLVLGFVAAWFTVLLITDNYRAVGRWTSADRRVTLVATRRNTSLTSGAPPAVDAINRAVLGDVLLRSIASVSYGTTRQVGPLSNAPASIELLPLGGGQAVALQGSNGSRLAVVKIDGDRAWQLLDPGPYR